MFRHYRLHCVYGRDRQPTSCLRDELADVEMTQFLGHPQSLLDLAVCERAVVTTRTKLADSVVRLLVAHVVLAGKLKMVDSLTNAEPCLRLFVLDDQYVLSAAVNCLYQGLAISETDVTRHVRIKQCTQWECHFLHPVTITTATSHSSSGSRNCWPELCVFIAGGVDVSSGCRMA